MMMPREKLKHWLADGRAQDATAERYVEVSNRLKSVPVLRRLRRELERSGRAVPAVLASARRAMTDEEGLEEIFACLLEGASADPFFRPALRSVATDIHSGLLLYDTPELTLFASVMTAEAIAAKRLARDGRRSIVFTGQLSLHKFVRAGGATLSLWEAPRIEAGFTAQESGQCRFVERRHLRDGELLELDGRQQTFVIDHARSDIVYLQAVTSVGRAPLTVEYDSETFGFVGASSTDEVSSRTQMMLALLRTMGRQDAVPLMIDLLDDANFYARWQAMRELLALDADAALPHLRRLAERDPHPEIRAAAAATLEACFGSSNDLAASEAVLEMN